MTKTKIHIPVSFMANCVRLLVMKSIALASPGTTDGVENTIYPDLEGSVLCTTGESRLCALLFHGTWLQKVCLCFTSLLVTPNSKLRIKPKEEQRKSSSKGFSLKHRINLLVASNQEKVLQVCRFRVFLALLCYHSKKPQTQGHLHIPSTCPTLAPTQNNPTPNKTTLAIQTTSFSSSTFFGHTNKKSHFNL